MLWEPWKLKRPLHTPSGIGDVTLALLDRPPERKGRRRTLYYRIQLEYADGQWREHAGDLTRLLDADLLDRLNVLLDDIRACARRRMVPRSGAGARGGYPRCEP